MRLSALKPAENGTDIVLRLYSIGEKSRAFVLDLPEQIKAVYGGDLKEQRETRQLLQGSQLRFQIEPAQIMTLILVL